MSKVKNQPRKQKTSHAAGRTEQQHDKAAMADAKASMPSGGQSMQTMGMPDAPMKPAHKKEKRFGHN
ncbi:hypothetical protein ABIA32_004147 [Streptacidiphilus sp. MAP12-20]|uniref:hypothetical protein n=1 Tax=Streptacidiphilus sp. MAP12-20 TaxID=3156299 RepID=UPI00351467C4